VRKDDPPNPYMDMPLGEFADACMRRAGELLKGEQAGRRDTAYMLIRAGHLPAAATTPGSPVALARAGQTAAAVAGLIADLEREQRNVRALLMERATDALLPRPTEPGELAAFVASLKGRAIESDEACVAALRELAQRHGQFSKPTKS
jgi:hypothetical protein